MAVFVRASGIVLTGGSSSRMGRDKALVTTGDPPTALAVRVARALGDGGCTDITCVGGELASLAALGLAVHPDAHPGEGPLGGVLTGLRIASLPIVVVLACDLHAITGAAVRGLVSVLSSTPSADVAVPLVDGRLQVHAAAYRRRSAPRLQDAFDAGERSLTRALRSVTIAEVRHVDRAVLVDADRPGDLPG